MNFREIDFILSSNSCTKPYFLGCVEIFNLIDFVKNKFDFNKEKNIIVVLLFEDGKIPPADAIGHYILLFWNKTITGNFVCTIFDSSKPTFDANTVKILKTTFQITKTKTVEQNSQGYQSPDSCVCGLYSIVVALFLCQGRTLQEISKLFDPQDKLLNDLFVYKFVKKYFGIFLNSGRLLHCDGLF